LFFSQKDIILYHDETIYSGKFQKYCKFSGNYVGRDGIRQGMFLDPNMSQGR
jgi:hypothetical protein